MSEQRYYVRLCAGLVTPLYQIMDRETEEPVNPLWFYARREDAEARVAAAIAARE